MGKTEVENQSLSDSIVESHSVQPNVYHRRCGCRWFRRIFGLRCLLVFVLSAAVFLSALFWLPPFLQFADRRDLDPDSLYKGHDIVASFYLKMPVSFLEDNISQLEDDILDEIDAPSVKVLSLEPLAGSNATDGSNMTKVVFAADSEVKNTKLPEAIRSLIRSTFESLVINQLHLRLASPMFGDPLSFEVLKFPGGITIIPFQSAYLLQKVQIDFNFTLNFSIHEIQANFQELTSQLKSGLHLAAYENLYIKLLNSKGSTVSPPTTVRSYVLLAVGTPSVPRLKQLAETISDSDSRNLGLNNAVFGKVKQVRLSSIMQHPHKGSDGRGSPGSPSPAPSPQPDVQHHNHHHHHHHHNHHHHHHHHHNHNHHHSHSSPVASPAPAPEGGPPAYQNGAPSPEFHSSAPKRSFSPTPERSSEPRPPHCKGGRENRSKGNRRNQSHQYSNIAPVKSPYYAVPAPKGPPNHVAASPQVPPVPVSGSVSSSSPLPSVQLPSKGDSNGEQSNAAPLTSPSSISSCSGPVRSIQWMFPLFWLLFCINL